MKRKRRGNSRRREGAALNNPLHSAFQRGASVGAPLLFWIGLRMIRGTGGGKGPKRVVKQLSATLRGVVLEHK
jgi:hypothetical protein